MTGFIRRIAMLLVLVAAPVAAQVPEASRSDTLSYDDFLGLNFEERRSAFRGASPAIKSALKREHARRWLAAHHASLSERQVAAVERAIAFISPDLYAGPPSRAATQRADDLRRDLECALGRDRVAEAFTFLPARDTLPSLRELVDEWRFWFGNCLG